MEDVRWSLDDMFKDKEEIVETRKTIEENIEKIEELKKNKEENIKDILLLKEKTERKLVHLYVYAYSKKNEDSRVTESQKLAMDAENIYNRYIKAVSFIEPLILSLDDRKIDDLLNDEDLKDFHIYIKRILRFKSHVLDENEEYILSSLSSSVNVAENIYYYLTTVDMKFPKIDSLHGKELTNTNFTLLQENDDVNVRKEAFNKYYDTYNSYRNTIATSLFSNMDLKEKIAKLKKFDSYRSMELFNDDVSLEVYDALIESIHRYLPKLHKYYALKKEMLGLDEQHMYDVYLPIIKGYNRKFDWEKGKELVTNSVEIMGKEYQDIYKTAFVNNWIDAFPRDAKYSGGYSTGSYDSYPYILINYNGNLDSVFTLGHEMGHSMHSYYAKKNNTFTNYEYTIFAAEVASTFNENLLLDYLKKELKDEKDKLFLLDFHLNSFKSTVFRQTMFAEFEKISHDEIAKGNSLTADDYDKIYLDLNKKYFGNDMVSDENISHEWMRIPHFYSDYYVYKYATGYCAATILSKRVIDKVDGAREDYIKFLKDGSKHFPIDQLKIAGIDMTDSKTIDKALDVFSNLVDELEELVKARRN